MGAYAFALPTTLGNLDGQANFTITFLTACGDGVNVPSLVEVTFAWDVTQEVATNISNLKTAIVNQCASQLSLKVPSGSVGVLMGAQ